MKIDGLVAAPFAAYYEDGSVNLEIIPVLLIDWFVRALVAYSFAVRTARGLV